MSHDEVVDDEEDVHLDGLGGKLIVRYRLGDGHEMIDTYFVVVQIVFFVALIYPSLFYDAKPVTVVGREKITTFTHNITFFVYCPLPRFRREKFVYCAKYCRASRRISNTSKFGTNFTDKLQNIF